MYKFVFVFLSIPAFSFAADYSLIECVGIPKPKEFYIEECPNGSPCNFEIGQHIHPHMTIHLDKPVKALPHEVALIRPNGELQFVPFKYRDLCVRQNGACPLEAGDYTFTGEVVVPEVVLGEDLLIAGVARDHDYKPIACYTAKAKTTKPMPRMRRQQNDFNRWISFLITGKLD